MIDATSPAIFPGPSRVGAPVPSFASSRSGSADAEGGRPPSRRDAPPGGKSSSRSSSSAALSSDLRAAIFDATAEPSDSASALPSASFSAEPLARISSWDDANLRRSPPALASSAFTAPSLAAPRPASSDLAPATPSVSSLTAFSSASRLALLLDSRSSASLASRARTSLLAAVASLPRLLIRASSTAILLVMSILVGRGVDSSVVSGAEDPAAEAAGSVIRPTMPTARETFSGLPRHDRARRGFSFFLAFSAAAEISWADFGADAWLP